MMEEFKFTLDKKDMEEIINFKLVEFWTQPKDFTHQENDPQGLHLKGFLFQRTDYTNYLNQKYTKDNTKDNAKDPSRARENV